MGDEAKPYTREKWAGVMSAVADSLDVSPSVVERINATWQEFRRKEIADVLRINSLAPQLEAAQKMAAILAAEVKAKGAEIAALKAEVDRLHGGCAISCDLDRDRLREALREAVRWIRVIDCTCSTCCGDEDRVACATELLVANLESALSSTGEVIAAKPWDEKRCRVCGWTLAASRDQGCAAPYDCSMRPMPTRMADGSGDTHEFLTRFHAAAKSTGEGGAAE